MTQQNIMLIDSEKCAWKSLILFLFFLFLFFSFPILIYWVVESTAILSRIHSWFSTFWLTQNKCTVSSNTIHRNEQIIYQERNVATFEVMERNRLDEWGCERWYRSRICELMEILCNDFAANRFWFMILEAYIFIIFDEFPFIQEANMDLIRRKCLNRNRKQFQNNDFQYWRAWWRWYA